MTNWKNRRLIVWQALVNLQQTNEKVTARNVCTATGISNYMDVLKHMKVLQKEGFLKREGKGVKTEWFVVEGPDGNAVPLTSNIEDSLDVRKVIRDGQEITICPPRYAKGYRPMTYRGWA